MKDRCEKSNGINHSQLRIKMNKKVLIGLSIILVTICVRYLLYKNDNEKRSTTANLEKTSESVSSSTDIAVLISPNDFTKGEEKSSSPEFRDTKTGDTVLFKLLTDKAHQARNYTYETLHKVSI